MSIPNAVLSQIVIARAAATGVLGLLAAGTPALADDVMAAAETLFAPIAVASPAQTAAPFGALSMLVLGGTLLAGLVAGAGLTAVRSRAGSQPASPSKTVPAQSLRKAATNKSAPPAIAVADLPVAAILSASPQPHALSIERWLEEIAEGPRFGPRIVGLVSPKSFPKADALSRIAEAAQHIDRDVALVDAGDAGSGELAAALDRQVHRNSVQSDPFGAAARIEIVPLFDILPANANVGAQDWSAGLQGLAARTDIVLVDLPDVATLARLKAALAALDDVILLHGGDGDAGTQFAEEARAQGVSIQTQIVVTDT